LTAGLRHFYHLLSQPSWSCLFIFHCRIVETKKKLMQAQKELKAYQSLGLKVRSMIDVDDDNDDDNADDNDDDNDDNDDDDSDDGYARNV